MPNESFKALLADVSTCALCTDEFSDGVRPALQSHPNARIIIAGQAPGIKVHNTGVPFDGASGDRLRQLYNLTYNAEPWQIPNLSC